MAADFVRVTGTTALQGMTTVAWVAAGGLPAGKRRAARLATTVAAVAVGWVAIPKHERPVTWTKEDGLVMVEAPEPQTQPEPETEPEPVDKRKLALTLTAMALSAAVMVSGRKLEKRWLTKMQRAGHPHPHLALAWRMGLLSAAASVPMNILEKKKPG